MVNPTNPQTKRASAHPPQGENAQKLSVSVKNFQFRVFQAFSGFSAHNVDVDLNGTVDHALGVGLIEQVYSHNFFDTKCNLQ